MPDFFSFQNQQTSEKTKTVTFGENEEFEVSDGKADMKINLWDGVREDAEVIFMISPSSHSQLLGG